MNPYGMYPGNLSNLYQSFPSPQISQFQGFNPQGFNQSAPTLQTQYYVRQVGNIEEAKGCPVDPGSQYLFIDNANKSVYVKFMGSDGLSNFKIYTLTENTNTEKTDTLSEVNKRLTSIETILGGMANAKPFANDTAGYEKSYTGATAGSIQSVQGAGPSEVSKRNGNDERQGRERSQTTGGEYRKGQGH